MTIHTDIKVHNDEDREAGGGLGVKKCFLPYSQPSQKRQRPKSSIRFPIFRPCEGISKYFVICRVNRMRL
jgi:hypothetical protein